MNTPSRLKSVEMRMRRKNYVIDFSNFQKRKQRKQMDYWENTGNTGKTLVKQ